MKYLFTLLFLLSVGFVSAQPANDDCAGAIMIPTIDDYCSLVDEFTNVGATETTGFGIPSNCVPPWSGGNRDVWFTFMTDAVILDVTIDVNGLTMVNPQIAIYRGDCTGLVELICTQAALGSNTLTLDVLGLDPNELYFIRINDYSTTGTPNSGTFQICIDQYEPPTVIDNVTVTTCAGTVFDTGDVGGQYMNNENIVFSICPTDPHDCVVLDIPSYNIENGFDNLFIYNGPNPTGAPIAVVTGSGSNLNIPVPTTGCVTLNFVTDGSVTADGFELSWQCSNSGCPVPPPDIMACTGSFFDTGGAGGNYANNENEQTIICPDDPTQCITLAFTTFDVENFFDNLIIYDGAGPFNPQIGSYTGTNSPGTVTATNDGCLTVVFTSDGSVTDVGWAANIVCATCGVAPPCTGQDPMCQGIPDDCISACDLGTLTAPGFCPGAVPIIQTFCISNVGATAEMPYNAQTGCQGGSDMDSPAADVWYSFIASANEMNITLQSNLTEANIGLYQGNVCSSLLNVDCATSNNDGTVTLSTNVLTPGSTYYLQISGADENDQADDMTLELESIKNCDNCNVSSTLVATPDPVNGTYTPGQTITFCYTVTEWTQNGVNWFHAIVPTFGPGWDVSTLAPVSAPPSCDGQGTWAWYNSWTSTNSGMTFGPGYAYDSPAGGPFDGDPGNNFGDNCQGAVNFQFCWSIQISSPFPTGVTQLDVDIDTYGDSETGSWGSEDCENDPIFLFSVGVNNCTQPAVAVNAVNADCGLGQLGSITLTPSGTGPFTYDWNDPNIGNTNSATGLPAGTYNIEVTDDGENCPVLVTVDILETGSLSPVANLISNVLCGTGFGSAEVIVSDGVGPYSYFWDNGETTAIAGSLGVGPHNVNVFDSNGCVGFASVIIGFDTESLSLSVAGGDTLCLGESTQLSVSGASTYSWSPPAGLNVPTSSSPIATPTQTTTYTVTGSVIGPNLVVNGNFEQGNTGFTTDYVPGMGGAFGNLSDPGTYAINTSPANEHINFAPCQDNSTVGIGRMLIGNGSNIAGTDIWCQTVSVEPGNEYTYSAYATAVVPGTPPNMQLLVDGTPLTSLQLSSTTCDWQFFGASFNSGSSTQVELCVTNTVIADGGNDFALDDIELRPVCQGTETVTVFVSDIGASVISVSNEICGGDGNGSAEVLGSGGFVATDYSYEWSDGQTTALATALPAGSYTVTVSDDNACSEELTVMITGPAPVGGTTQLLAPSTCEGANPGQAFVTPNAGGSPFTFLWDNGETGFQAFNLSPGVHTVTITNSSGCTGVESIDIPTTLNPTIDGFQAGDASCGLANGGFSISATGDMSTLQYSIDGGFSFQNSPDFANLSAGDYAVVVLDTFGCQSSAVFTLGGTTSPVLDVQIGASACNGATGELNVSASEGTAPYSYSIDGGVTFQSSGLFENLPAGTYDVVVEDDAGCTDMVQVEIGSSTVPQITTQVVDASCEDSNGEIEITITDGTPPYIYSIDGGASFSNNGLFQNLPDGTYDIVVADDVGCDNMSTVTINNTPLPQLVSEVFNATCEEDNGTILAIATEGTPPFEYSIDGGSTFVADPNFLDLSAGTYQLQVRDAAGCVVSQNDIEITNTENPMPSISASGPDTEICGEESITLNAGAYSAYAWSTGAIESSISVNAEGIYSVVVTDEFGCTGSAEIEITDCDLYGIPNAFSPNGDGLNDEFGIEIQGDVEILDFQIFNRWGELVHNNTGYWDGRYKNEMQPMDVYIYKVVLRVPGQEDEMISGDVTLIR